MRIESLPSVRKFLALTVALAVLGAVVVPVSAARPAPSSNPFAGRFVGDVPGDFGGGWSISINGGGRIRGAIDVDAGIIILSGSFTGTVDAAGNMTCSGSQYWAYWTTSGTTHFSFTATVTLDSAGNIVGITDTGESFVWTRQ